MKWLEIIELQSVSSNHKKIKSKLNNMIDEICKSTENNIVKVYYRFSLDSDLSIHIQHHSDDADINGSTKGMQLASTLKEFGLTNHSIWIENQGE